VWEILKDAGVDPAPHRASTTWADFLRSQADALLVPDQAMFALSTTARRCRSSAWRFRQMM
ncbi:hypothetical protein ACFWCY_56360, partial [Streptomyces mirabilis]